MGESRNSSEKNDSSSRKRSEDIGKTSILKLWATLREIFCELLNMSVCVCIEIGF